MRFNVELESEQDHSYRTKKFVIDPFKVTMIETNVFGQNIVRMDNGDGFVVHPKIKVTEILQRIERGRSDHINRIPR
jgi:hypothetical protein